MQEITAEVKGHFLRLYQMAVTDGSFSPVEWKMMYDFASKRGVSQSDLENILLTTTGVIEAPNRLEDRIEYLYDLVLMSNADGTIDDDEYYTLKKFAKKFEFLDENISSMLDYLIACAKADKNIEQIITEINSGL